jgi:general secretion pathway protein G
MALAFCTRCGHRVSTTAPRCPSCGTPPYSGRVSNTASTDAPANTPTAPVASQESTAPPIRPATPSVVTLRIAKPHILIAAAVVMVAIVGWWLSYIPRTPSYAIYEFYETAAAHDGAAAVSYFDFDSITSKVIDDIEAESLKGDSGEEAFGSIVGGAMLGMMSKPLAGALRSRLEQRIENLTPDEVRKTREVAFEAAWNIHRTGRTAHTSLTDPQGKRLDLTLMYSADDGWRVTEIGGPSAHEIAAEATEQVAPDAANRAKKTKAQADLVELKTALDRFYLDNGYYPSTDQGLQALVSAPTSGRIPTNYESGGYIERLPPDPWGSSYFYRSDGSSYVLKSFGPDGVESGDDVDASQP